MTKPKWIQFWFDMDSWKEWRDGYIKLNFFSFFFQYVHDKSDFTKKFHFSFEILNFSFSVRFTLPAKS
jgi:hypothetical protein